MNKRALAGLVAFAVLALDQITKIWAVAALSDAPVSLVDGFLRFALARNPGASFSTFTNAGQFIGLIAVGVVVVVFFMVDRVNHRLDVVGLGFVMGGAAGNLTDRIFRGEGFLDGAVVDFIDFDFFPSFNVADTAINIGVALLLIGTFFAHRLSRDDEAIRPDSAGDTEEAADSDA